MKLVISNNTVLICTVLLKIINKADLFRKIPYSELVSKVEYVFSIMHFHLKLLRFVSQTTKMRIHAISWIFLP